MHGRHRSPANGYNRFGPEGSGRPRGFHGSGNRFGRGFGRGRGQGQFRPFRSPPQPSPPPRNGGDIFVEAGRMAAEYLVSKGLLSPDVLSGDKWTNGSLTKQGQDIQEFRGDGNWNGDGGQIQLDGRVPAHSRLRNAGFDTGSGRRRNSEDYSPRGTRNHWKGSRRGGSFRGYNSDLGREYGRNSTSSDRNKVSPDREGCDNVAPGRDRELQVEKDNEDITGKSEQNDLVLKADKTFESTVENNASSDEMTFKDADGSESKIENDTLTDEMALTESFSGAKKDGQTEADSGLAKDSTTMNENIEEVIDSSSSEEIKEKVEGDLSIEYSAAEGSNSGDNCANLLAFCNPMKVPTRIRSSLASRISKVNLASGIKDKLKSKMGSQNYGFARGSFGDSPSHNCHSTKNLNSDANKAMSVDSPGEKEMSAAQNVDQNQYMDSQPYLDAEAFFEQSAQAAGNSELGHGLVQDKCTRSSSSPLGESSHGQTAECIKELSSSPVVEQNKCFRSNSFSEKDFFHQVDLESSHGSESCLNVQERAEKRALEDSELNGGSKKVREWLPPAIIRTDDHMDLIGKIGSLKEEGNSSVTPRTDDHLHVVEKIGNVKEEGDSTQNELPMKVTQESLTNISQFQKHGGESSVHYAQEKQFFPASFSYNANIMDAPDRSGNRQNDPSQLYPSISGITKEMPIDIGLSMNSHVSGQYSSHLTNVKEIEVIDLEDDSGLEEKANNNDERMSEAEFNGLGAYPNPPPTSGVITDVQDNYDGLTISDYFNSFPNCAPAPADINPLPNEIGMPNGEGTLADDDSIYMSLDELPLGLLRTWEQPPSEEYDKNF